MLGTVPLTASVGLGLWALALTSAWGCVAQPSLVVVRVSVRVEPHQLRHSEFVTTVASAQRLLATAVGA